ncbi:hypothetical protein [Pseudanabaena sp. ABRG5-3]|uniref:hypothetical protein n=1 Tax=Pseudanabaena sp. ABRG5-3 TaxID=685565 RepID=UPI0013A679AD|nr:hypothetical protein [Pseudanabaena sp. ABRG5-3]
MSRQRLEAIASLIEALIFEAIALAKNGVILRSPYLNYHYTSFGYNFINACTCSA